jgi:transposase InsO family protein
MENCSSSGLRSRTRASPSTWSNGGSRPGRDGEPSCVTTRRTLPPWTCSLFPTIGFDLLYAFVIVRLDRRDLVWINVTANPTAEWVARQTTEAFPWDEAPHYLIRDRDQIYSAVVTRRLRAMGIRDKPTAPASPWQNGYAERLIGSIRRECVDHIIVLGETHLRRVLKSCADYYNSVRTHRSLDKDAPVSRPVQRAGGSVHAPSWADFITTTPELKFSVHTGGNRPVPTVGSVSVSK